jgi:hypothetical protein
LDVLDSSCPVDGAEGDIDGDAKVELALDDGDHGPAADELGLAQGLQELLQALLEVLALVPESVWAISEWEGRGASEWEEGEEGKGKATTSVDALAHSLDRKQPRCFPEPKNSSRHFT